MHTFASGRFRATPPDHLGTTGLLILPPSSNTKHCTSRYFLNPASSRDAQAYHTPGISIFYPHIGQAALCIISISFYYTTTVATSIPTYRTHPYQRQHTHHISINHVSLSNHHVSRMPKSKTLKPIQYDQLQCPTCSTARFPTSISVYTPTCAPFIGKDLPVCKNCFKHFERTEWIERARTNLTSFPPVMLEPEDAAAGTTESQGHDPRRDDGRRLSTGVGGGLKKVWELFWGGAGDGHGHGHAGYWKKHGESEGGTRRNSAISQGTASEAGSVDEGRGGDM